MDLLSLPLLPKKLARNARAVACGVAGLALPLVAAAQGNGPDFARSLTINLGLQGRVMWIDGTANIDRIKTLDGVRDVVARCKKANITTLVVDVKPVSGQVLFDSKIAEHLTRWRDKSYPDFDTLAAFVDEGHRAGMDVCASFNVLGEGHKYFSVGLAYSKPQWQSVTYEVDRSLVAQNGAKLPIRAAGEAEVPGRTLINGPDYIQMPTATPGTQIAVALDEDRHVAGIIDTALLEDQPLAAPESGHMLVLSGPGMDWASRNLKAGDATRFDAVGRRVIVTQADTEKISAFINPLQPEARKYEMDLLTEVARNYNVDGMVFDRLRYANLYNDYSDLTRDAFQTWLGRPVRRWPEDVIAFDPEPGRPVRRGPLFKPWLEFRARVIRGFVDEATDRIRAVKPNMQFAAYVGSWFSEYYGVGVNWGSEKFPVRTGWATQDYNEAGYAEYLDWLSTGCYYPIPTRQEARVQHKEDGGTVEAAAELSTAVVANSVPVYGGLYALQYQGRPQDFARAIDAAARSSQGVMIFDLSYIYDYNWWDVLDKAFAQPALAPHRIPGLTEQLRSAEDAVRRTEDARGSDARLPAVPYQAGGG